MFGAIIGDIIGAPYEGSGFKFENFHLFVPTSQCTDDSVMTVAVADAILNGMKYTDAFKKWWKLFPNAGYGVRFNMWLKGDLDGPINSFGNGSAMRVSPIAWAFNTLEEVEKEAYESAKHTHGHPEGIKAAQAVATAIFMAHKGATKTDIKQYIEDRYQYNLSRSLVNIREDYSFNATAQGSVPESIIAFLVSSNFEDAIRKSISLGGDADTMAAITGSIAHAFYGIPKEILEKCDAFIPNEISLICDEFADRFPHVLKIEPQKNLIKTKLKKVFGLN